MKTIFLYLPVVHKQALDFLVENKKYPIWLLNNETGKEENVYLERDLRALPATAVKTELESHGFSDVTVVGPENLKDLVQDVESFIVTEDEIVLDFIQRYAKNALLEKKDIFIRWIGQLSTTEFEVPTDRTITEDDFAQQLISELEDEAQKSPDWWRQIAAAAVKDGKIISMSHNKHYPGPQTLSINGDPRSNLDAGQGPGIYTSIHAEAAVIAKCARKGIATEGADVYVTTFPCPTCARSIVEAGFKTVFYKKGYSLLDAEEILKNEGIEIVLVQEK